MKKTLSVFSLLIACCAAVGFGVGALAQNFQITTYPLQFQQPGPRLIDGNVVNGLIARTNGAVCPSTAAFGGTGAVDTTFFVATQRYFVLAASVTYSVTNGAALTMQITKDTSTNAPGAGTDLLVTPFNLNLTANTPQVGALVTVNASKTLAIGDRIAYDLSTAPQAALAQTVATVCMVPLFD